MNSWRKPALFSLPAIRSKQRTKAEIHYQKATDGKKPGKVAAYCSALLVSRQGFYKYLNRRNRPWKYRKLTQDMQEIYTEDPYNDTYGSTRIYQALLLKQPQGVQIPGERTVYRVMEILGLSHRPKRSPNSLTQNSDNLLKQDFSSSKPLEKCVTDITEINGGNRKLYVAAIFDCYDRAVLGLAMDTNMKALLCARTVENAVKTYLALRSAVIHSDRGSQYTGLLYRQTIQKGGLIQSMNSAGGRCHDNARCESMWARMKEELFYSRLNSQKIPVAQLKESVWHCFFNYWNNRRICSANGGLPPMVKRQRYYHSL